MSEPLGLYKPWNVREIPDNELEQQYLLLDAEKARREKLENSGQELDEFLTNRRIILGATPYFDGMDWFEPADVFDAYPKGLIVKGDDDHYYKSLQHANEAELTYKMYWQDLGTAEPQEVRRAREIREKTE